MKVDLSFVICNLRNNGYEVELSVDKENKPKVMFINFNDYASFYGAKNYVEEYFSDIKVYRNDRLMLVL